jgi:heat shock protein HslJ
MNFQFRYLIAVTCSVLLFSCTDVSEQHIEDQEWVLTELMGQEVKAEADGQLPAVTFDSASGRVQGNDGCNRFNSIYELPGEGQIKINPGMTSLKACPDMETPDKFNQMLLQVDQYVISGNVLSLGDADNESLAKFKLAG